MKTTLKYIAKHRHTITIAVLLAVIFCAGWKLRNYNHEISRLTEFVQYQNVNLRDSLTTLYSNRSIAEKDTLIKAHKQELVAAQKKVDKLTIQLKNLKAENESLMIEYDIDKTLDNCDDVVKSQIKVITKQDTIIKELGSEVEVCLNINGLLEQKISLKDTIIISKVGVIKIQDLHINKLIEEKEKLAKKAKNKRFWNSAALVAVGTFAVMQSVR